MPFLADSARAAAARDRASLADSPRAQSVARDSLAEQFAGPQGELAAAMRYFTQALSEDDAGRKDMLIDIATEELSHFEVIGTAETHGGDGAAHATTGADLGAREGAGRTKQNVGRAA